MQKMTTEQKQLLAKRQSHFEAFLAERAGILVDFFEHIGATPATAVVSEPEQYLVFLDQFLKTQHRNTFSPEDITYLRARLIYFVGEYLVQRFNGKWRVNENPASVQFGRYVIGGFAERSGDLTVDPAAIAQAYFEGKEGSGLQELLRELALEPFAHNSLSE